MTSRHERNGAFRSSGLAPLVAVLLVACGDSGASDESGDAAPVTQPRQEGAAVFVYHHVSNETPPATSITPESFERQLDYLADNDFTVWPLQRIVEATEAGEQIPPRTVSLTFDDAYASVHDTALPQLEARGWPFTVFVSTRYIDDGLRPYATWDELRRMEAGGATLANHSVSHPSLAAPAPGESEREWLRRARREIANAQARLEAELDAPARYFAWPYGEYSPPVQKLLEEMGYTGFAQRSGAVGPLSPRTALPRFPMATGFDDLDDFALKARSRPLPVRGREPESGVLAPDAGRPSVTLTLAEGHYRADALRCYSGGRALAVRTLGESPLRVRVGPPESEVAVGRTIYNCTAPARDADAWYWHSVLWMRPHDDGSWYEG